MSGFIRTILFELEAATRIGILTVALGGFMAFRGEYGVASISIETQSNYTATVGLMRQMGR